MVGNDEGRMGAIIVKVEEKRKLFVIYHIVK